jgi:DNA-binding GntR family transcriptional regulator
MAMVPRHAADQHPGSGWSDTLARTPPPASHPYCLSDRINLRGRPLLWQHVAVDLRADMDSGELAADTRLAGENDLAEMYGVSRETIRRAIQEHVSEGRLEVLHGRGTFVLPKPPAQET